MNKHLTTKRIVMTALMAALTVAGSALRIKVPSIVGTSAFHLGNIMCALSGILLGPWLGGLASGLGSALYDILLDPAYISESWITLLTKGAYGLVAGLGAYGFRTNWHAATKKYLRALLYAGHVLQIVILCHDAPETIGVLFDHIPPVCTVYFSDLFSVIHHKEFLAVFRPVRLLQAISLHDLLHLLPHFL